MLNLRKLIAAAVVAGFAFPAFAATNHNNHQNTLVKPAVTAKVQKGTQGKMAKLQVPVNINTATAQVLEQVKGIGPKKAQAIIAYRNKNGNFKTVKDLAKVKGFGPKGVKKVQKQLTVG